MNRKAIMILIIVGLLYSVGATPSEQKTTSESSTVSADSGRWSKQRANEWYRQYPWLVGANFNPSTAINQLETWQEGSFDPKTIDRELGYAESIGMNVMRVYLHHLAWETDPDGFKRRMEEYLEIADGYGILTLFVFFDDCWNPTYKAGKQPEPKPGVHNSGWVQDPGPLIQEKPEISQTLEAYVKDVMGHFADDKRILLWDLYNEPGNSGHGNESLPLLRRVFQWAREINPSQPLSAGYWNGELKDLNQFQLEHSDVITYHNYQSYDEHVAMIDMLKSYERPMICSEYMARTRGNTFFNMLPLLNENNIAAINWGLVSGKSNTIFAWDTPVPSGAEPKVWFHDIFRPDGSAYSDEEIVLIKSLTGSTNTKTGGDDN